MQLPTFDNSLNHISLENRIKKLNKKINKLKIKVDKKIKIVASNGKVNDINTQKKLRELTRMWRNYKY
jgi:hypothetical protein